MDNANKSAYPRIIDSWDNTRSNETVYKTENGLSKRERFAMAAMQGLLSTTGEYYNMGHVPKDAVEIADALLTELEE